MVLVNDKISRLQHLRGNFFFYVLPCFCRKSMNKGKKEDVQLNMWTEFLEKHNTVLHPGDATRNCAIGSSPLATVAVA